MEPMDELVHGRRSTYTKHKCHCKECRRANAEYKSNKTAHYRNLQASVDRKDDSSNPPADLPKITHGTLSAYEWYGCRCEEGKKAERLAYKMRSVNRIASSI